MATVTPVLWTHKKNKHGLCPIYLRIQADGKTRYHSLKIYIQESQWSESKARVKKSARKDAQTINSTISDKIAKAEHEIYMLMKEGRAVKAGDVKERVSEETTAGPGFIAYGRLVTDQLERQGKLYTARQYRTIFNKLERFTGKPFPFDALTPAFLREYETHLTEKYKNKPSTIAANMQSIRAVVYRAIRDGIVDQGHNPFFNYSVRSSKTAREKLALAEIKAIEDLDIEEGTDQWRTRDYFLFSFYCAGIRFGDMAMMKCKHVADGRLRYTMKKTGGNKSMKLVPQALAISERYVSDDPEAYLFPMLVGVDTSTPRNLLNGISYQNKLANEILKDIAAAAEITKHLTFHMSRHSFADIARQKGWDVYAISKALGHANLKVTENYLKGFDQEGLDEKMDDLFGGGE